MDALDFQNAFDEGGAIAKQLRRELAEVRRRLASAAQTYAGTLAPGGSLVLASQALDQAVLAAPDNVALANMQAQRDLMLAAFNADKAKAEAMLAALDGI